jgi:hypothetical protein
MKLIFLVSDALFPICWLLLMILLKKKGFSNWKAWGLASSFCLTQAYLVAKFIGWNVGGYFLFFIASIPSFFLGDALQKDNALNDLIFWVFPPIGLIIIPMGFFYLFSKTKYQSVDV